MHGCKSICSARNKLERGYFCESAWSRNKPYYTGKPSFLSLLPSTRRSPWTMLISFVNRSIVPYVIALSLCRMIARLCAKHAIALDWLHALIARACLSVFIQRFLYQHVSKIVETSIMRRSQWKPCSIRFRIETLCKIENRGKDVKWNAWSQLKIATRIRRYFFYLAGSAMWPTSTRLTDIDHYF